MTHRPGRAAWMAPALLTLTAACALAACSGKDAGNNAAANNAALANGADNISAIPEDGDAMAVANGSTGNGAADNMAAAGSAVADGWTGRWTGPEGLFLDVAKGEVPGTYRLTLKDNLDSQADYVGKAVENGIAFTRAGKTVTIHAGPGHDTGFKYLIEKENCLILETGKEGYCR